MKILKFIGYSFCIVMTGIYLLIPIFNVFYLKWIIKSETGIIPRYYKSIMEK